MRVVFLTPEFPRRSSDHSGAPLLVLARALMRRGISIRVVAAGSENAGVTELEGISVRRVRAPLATGFLVAGRVALAWKALARGLRQELALGADLIHAHSWAPAGLATPARLPVVLSIQSSDAAMLRRSRMARRLARRVVQRARVVATSSREIAGWIESGTGRHVGSQHIYPPPVESRGHPWTRGGGGALTISPLDSGGRVGLALETMAVLASCGHNLPLTIIGAGPDRNLLEKQAADLGITALVRFAGGLSLEEAGRYLDRADLLLFTAKADGVACAATEALVSGIPAVACWDSGAAAEMVPESGPGRLTLPEPQALADAILGLHADPDRLAMARLIGESWRARLAPDRVAEVCQGWYREALAGPPPPPSP